MTIKQKLSCIIILFLSLSNVVSSFAQENEIPETLVGNVKSVFSFAYSPKTENNKTVRGNPEYSFEYNFRKIFDEQGKLIKQYNLGYDTNIISVTEYKSEPLSGETVIKITSPEGKTIKKTVCKCNDKEKPYYCTSISFNSRETDTIFYKYDQSDRVTYKLIKSSNLFLSKRTEYYYDDRGNITALKIFSFNNALVEDYVNIYNEKNQRIEEKSVLFEDSISKRNTFKYNEKGNLVKIQSYKKNTTPDKCWDFEYIYDAIGNWTSMIISKNNKARLVVLRKIEYYL
jgi:hypothetical protein